MFLYFLICFIFFDFSFLIAFSASDTYFDKRHKELAAKHEKNNAAFNKVKMDKEREVKNGHDGTWVAHPGLVPTALDVFGTSIPGKNQLDVSLDNINITQEDLLEVHSMV